MSCNDVFSSLIYPKKINNSLYLIVPIEHNNSFLEITQDKRSYIRAKIVNFKNSLMN